MGRWRRRGWLSGSPATAPTPEATPVGVPVGRGGTPPRRRVRLRPPGRLFSPGGAGALAPALLWAQGDGGGARTTCRRLSRPLPVGDPRQLTDRLQSTPRGARGSVAGLGPPPTPARLAAPSSPARMARLLTVTLGCISLLYLQLPGALSLSLAGSRPPTRLREPPARTPASSSQPRYPAALPAVWKLHQALQPKKSASLVPARGQPLRSGPRRHLGSRRPRAQLLRVGCALGTCQVQNLSHRLWRLVGSAGPRDSAPVDPSSPHSYG